MVSTPEKRLWLRRQYALVPGTYATLLLALQARAFALADLVGAGAVSSTSAGDRSTSFSNSSNGGTPQDMAELGGEMLDLYEIANAALVAGGIPAPTDAQRMTEMLDRLQPITELRTAYTGLRQ
jgi:hypothetical protein